MEQQKISLQEAQQIILSSQMLMGPNFEPLQVIEHLGYVQIDTISVVERAHHHVFWTRCPKYKPADLNQLVRSRKIFEHWSHAASYLPMKDYRFSLPMKKELASQGRLLSPKDQKLMKSVLKRIKEEGPLRSIDFKKGPKSKKTGWWDWKPAKKALERLFLAGKLEVARREGFQKVYDLPERVVPTSVNTTFPTKKEQMQFLIRRTLRNHGLATAREIGYLKKKTVINAIRKEIEKMLLAKEIIEVSVQGVEELYYSYPELFNNSLRTTSKILILSPFDNFVIQRKKLSRFFNFDYQIECYVPQPKRKYGYFCLPVFNGINPLGRIDCKADRESKEFIVQSIHCEEGIAKEWLKSKMNSKLKKFAKFNGCNQVKFRSFNVY